MKGFRYGLGFEDWWTIHAALDTQGRAGAEAIEKLRREVPDYDHKVDFDRRRNTVAQGSLDTHGGDRKSEDQGAIGTLKRGTNSARYLIARLKRDAPDFADRYAAGEFRSARAAAIAAGIIEPPTPLDEFQADC